MRIPEDMKVGAIHETNSFGKLEITNYIDCCNVEVRFVDTGFVVTTRSEQVRNGSVMDKFKPNVYGVGFLGDGKYAAIIKSKQTKGYKCWTGMLERCYSEAGRKRCPTYIGCTVHPDWHNFQTFAKWYHENYPTDGRNYQLDKDILVYGNKVYSSGTCLFVTHKENTIKAHAKSYAFVSPNGVVTEVYNLRKFCRDNDLNNSHMCQVYLGKLNQHKGWRLA